ncbi:phosphate ABC transporter substrate-binding protein [Pararhodobacter oceanensis]|uniref:Phosphate ABC transporter substrate-binding protein n=2 Tax=Pararhodobacter oceanensis TaxID=2172121 RepID=A0A2T8HT42_9RHOB|nr:phosphate ABC transporter substrate-binding protein [Pararhodobacter oceanensis]
MYDWPEARGESLAFWRGVRANMQGEAPGVDLPEALEVLDWEGVQALWRDPAMVFSQTCWGPLSLGLIEHVKPLAQPEYSTFAGGRGVFYRSALIAREGEALAVPETPETPEAALPEDLLAGRIFAYNSKDSLSGYLGLARDLGAAPEVFARRTVATGGHRASVQAVAAGRAEIAAIDCRSWAMAQRYEPCAAALTVVGWTSERLGLPYVTSRKTPEHIAERLRKALITLGCLEVPAGRME